MQYSTIILDSHATKGFAQMEQGPGELLDMYLHCANELLSKIYHTSDMSRILVKGLWTKLQKGKGQCCWNAQRKTMGDFFRDIYNIGAGYKKAKGYCRAHFNTPEASTTTEVKTTKEPRPCYRCSTSKGNRLVLTAICLHTSYVFVILIKV